MQYISTRGKAPKLDFEGVLLTGLASDGGLYVPVNWPQHSPADLTGLAHLSYTELGTRLLYPFVESAISETRLGEIFEDVYHGFTHRAVAPLKQLAHSEYVLELFHGPTLAFKDFALQVMGRILDEVLSRRDEKIVILGATSGDTGSAAIAGCQGRKNMEIFILHPKGRMTEVQRRQMTTVTDANVHNIALEGTFDDCQNLVKKMFNDQAFRKKHQLVAVNSINWARIMAQTVYYFYSALALGAPQREIAYSVPTGNFGDIYAGYMAKRMGLPVERLIIATNTNDILPRFLRTGVYERRDAMHTLSPSMDIAISSNFERLLFGLHDRDGMKTSMLMRQFQETGQIEIEKPRLERARVIFDAHAVTDTVTLEMIRQVYEETGEIVDPHTAIGIRAARKCWLESGKSTPVVTLATAHPAKFPDAVEKAIGIRPGLPPHMTDLFEKEERFDTMPNDYEQVKAFVDENSG